MPGQDPLHWLIRDVQDHQLFILEMQLDRALLTFEWYFEQVSDDRTKMTQRIVLSGENAAAYAQQVEAGFAPNLRDGMKRLAADMDAAAQQHPN